MLAKACALWEGLAAVPVSFEAGHVRVVVSPRSLMCPPGWVGIVALQGAAIATAPNYAGAEQVQAVLESLPVEHVTDPDLLRGILPIGKVLGPAALAYADSECFRPAPVGARAIEELASTDPGMRALMRSAGTADADESGLDEITSPAFTLRAGSQVIAAAGYRRWPSSTAHVSVLTAPEWRGQGLAAMVATAAVKHALTQELTPQWRARSRESRHVARSIGFRELGSQLSVELSGGRRS
ncbi:GNAT family N-acetyltransferase [Nocardia sp. NPDC048505]|uniref:GNAT family N-acetyltransferase n=1 Tax=unclassified Nocardia TaxID=2637762 RepID=UPI0033C727B4